MHLFLSYFYLFLFAQRLPNNSLNNTFFQTLLYMKRICGDWSDWRLVDFIMPVIPDVCECSADLCTAFPGKPLFLPLQKWHLVAKNELAFYSDQHEKINKWAGNMLIFHVDVTMKRLGIHFKNDLFQWFRVDSFFRETITLYTVHFQISNFAGCFHSLRAVLHTAWKIIFKNP